MADGLKKLRSKQGRTPEYSCSNCKCKRYSPCGCMKKGTMPNTAPIPTQDTEANEDGEDRDRG